MSGTTVRHGDSPEHPPSPLCQGCYDEMREYGRRAQDGPGWPGSPLRVLAGQARVAREAGEPVLLAPDEVQCPANDGGSRWWQDAAGAVSRAGMLTFLSTPEGPNEFRIM